MNVKIQQQYQEEPQHQKQEYIVHKMIMEQVIIIGEMLIITLSCLLVNVGVSLE